MRSIRHVVPVHRLNTFFLCFRHVPLLLLFPDYFHGLPVKTVILSKIGRITVSFCFPRSDGQYEANV
jgi:hypothetical protein